MSMESGKSRDTGRIGYTRRRQTKQIRNTVCAGHHYAQAHNRKKILNKTWALLQTPGVKNEPSIVPMQKTATDTTTRYSESKNT